MAIQPPDGAPGTGAGQDGLGGLREPAGTGGGGRDSEATAGPSLEQPPQPNIPAGGVPVGQGTGGRGGARSPSALPLQDPSREPTQRLLCCQRPRWALGWLRGLDLGPRAPGSSLSVRLSHRPRAPLGLCVHDTPRGASSRPLGRQRLGLGGPLPSTRGRSLPTQGPQPVRTASPDAG